MWVLGISYLMVSHTSSCLAFPDIWYLVVSRTSWYLILPYTVLPGISCCLVSCTSWYVGYFLEFLSFRGLTHAKYTTNPEYIKMQKQCPQQQTVEHNAHWYINLIICWLNNMSFYWFISHTEYCQIVVHHWLAILIDMHSYIWTIFCM